MDRRIKLSRTDVFLLVLTVLFLLTVGAVYLLTPHTVRKDYTVEAQVPVEAPAEERVDINTADADELDALPGIGPVLARRIIDWRAGLQLQNVEGLRFTEADHRLADGQRAICQSGAAAGGGRHRTGHAGRAA